MQFACVAIFESVCLSCHISITSYQHNMLLAGWMTGTGSFPCNSLNEAWLHTNGNGLVIQIRLGQLMGEGEHQTWVEQGYGDEGSPQLCQVTQSNMAPACRTSVPSPRAHSGLSGILDEGTVLGRTMQAGCVRGDSLLTWRARTDPSEWGPSLHLIIPASMCRQLLMITTTIYLP